MVNFTENQIRTFYQVCDARDSCSENIYGPEIKMHFFDNFTDTEFNYKMILIKQDMERLDLDESFGNAIACILTFKVSLLLNKFINECLIN